MSLPETAEPHFADLTEWYQDLSIEKSSLKAITLAQWALESGWGSSELSDRYNNYAGMKWRDFMSDWAKPVYYTAHDGVELYCSFASPEDFINGYWARLDLIPWAYGEWRDHSETPQKFINYIGGTWVGTKHRKGREIYVEKVLRIWATRTRDLFADQC